MNRIYRIRPYFHDGVWVFDDAARGLEREPFVSGMPQIIERIIHDSDHLDLREARQGFHATFSADPLPGCDAVLHHVRREYDGHWYRLDHPPMEGWLCPAMFRFFTQAPPSIYIRVAGA